MNNLKKDLSDETLKFLEWEIIRVERKNAKSHEKKDVDMVKELVSIIKKEVDRTER